MAIIDSYRTTLLRKRDELAKLNQDLAHEQAKVAPLQQKIISAKSAISRTKSESTIKSKLLEIDRANKSIMDIQKRCSSIQSKIAQKAKECATADKNYRNEEAKLDKKAADEKKKLLQQEARRSAALEQALRQQEQRQVQMQREIDNIKAIPEKITVLFLASNPINTHQLRLDEEARLIQEKIRLSAYRDSVQFESRWATRATDIFQAINETNPTIVHFSGHGAATGELVLQNSDGNHKLVSVAAISAAMATMSDTIRLIVFNACFSEMQARSVVEHIEAAIGTSDTIEDAAACTFAAQLYSSIGFGHSLKKSFDQAKAELLLEGIPGEDIPQIYCRSDVDLGKMILVQPNT